MMGVDITQNWLPDNIRSALTHLGATELSQSDAAENTGIFLYDLDRMAAHLKQLQQQKVVKLWYAVKANPLSAVIDVLAEQGFNFDVASYGELQQVTAQGVSGQQVLNTGPAKSVRQFKAFLQQGVKTYVIESVNQLNWLNQAAKDYPDKPQVLLRVQLQWPEGEKNPLGGNELTPFGLSCQQWQSIVLSDYPYLNINGLHIFQWGNLLSAATMMALWQQMVPPLVQLAQDLKMSLQVLDLGGGLGVDYLQTGQQISWTETIENLEEIKATAGVQELWLELGRFAVAEFGYYVTTVVDRKTNYQQQQLILDGGINHLLRPAITGQGFPVALARSSDAQAQSFALHGPLCTSLDKLGCFSLAGDISVGDELIFGYAGAYGFTESMPFFLCHPVAAEYVLEDNEVKLIRPAQPAAWYLR